MFRRNTPSSPETPSSSSSSSLTDSVPGQVSAPTPPVGSANTSFVTPSAPPPSFPPLAKAGSAMQAKATTTPTSTPARPEPARQPSPPSYSNPEGKTLTVGRDIALSGSISSCERLVVEGSVEADLTDAVALEVSNGGRFLGTAEVEEADIAGTVEGTLTARKRLTIRSTGVVKGMVRYAKLAVETGGRIEGTVEPLNAESPELPLRAPAIPPFRSE